MKVKNVTNIFKRVVLAILVIQISFSNAPFKVFIMSLDLYKSANNVVDKMYKMSLDTNVVDNFKPSQPFQDTKDARLKPFYDFAENNLRIGTAFAVINNVALGTII